MKKKKEDTLERVDTCHPNIVSKSQVRSQFKKLGGGWSIECKYGFLPGPARTLATVLLWYKGC